VGLSIGLITPLPISVREAQGIPDGWFSVEALFALPKQFLIVCLLYGGMVSWTEENIFRGHLLSSFSEVGLRKGPANRLQALVFVAYHIPSFLMGHGVVADKMPLLIGISVWLLLFGLLAGALRIRRGSIVLPFALHASFDEGSFVIEYGWMATQMANA